MQPQSRVFDQRDRALQRYARLAGALILVSFAAGLFGEVYVPSALSAATSNITTAHSVASRETLMHIGFAAYFIEALCDIVLTMIFYVILRPVDRNLALLATLFRLAATATFAASEFFYLAAMVFAGNSKYLRTFSPSQLDALTHFSFAIYGYGGSAPVFYGAAAIVVGYLIYQSGFLPRLFGAVWVIGGLGQVGNAFALILAPAYASFWEYVPLLVAMLTLALWFLVRGVNVQKWLERTTSQDPALNVLAKT